MIRHQLARCIGGGLLLLVLVAVAGCGYTLVGTASNIPEHIETVYLEPFENTTQRVQVEQILTQAVADELVRRSRLTVVSTTEEADSLITGIVTGLITTPVTFDAEGRATEYMISITVQVAFVERISEETIWKNERYLFRENFISEPSALTFIDREKIALEQVSGSFARTLVSDLLEGF